MSNTMIIKLAFLISTLLAGQVVLAQGNNEDLEVINLEELYKNNQPVQKTTTEAVQPAVVENATVANETATSEVMIDEKEQQQQKEIQLKELKDLNQLVLFSDLSVIQKKFLPKTERLELYLGAGLTTNTPWFTNYGGKVNLSYNFTELFGLELSSLFLATSERDVAKEIRENNNLKPDQFIYTKGYYGLDLKFSPVYGKIAWQNESITNYEMYFTVGGGISNTNSKEGNVPTAHVGLGQIFALSKSMAFRWDYAFNFFQATPVDNGGTSGSPSKGMYQDFVLTAGVSFFFPEAGYR